MDLARRGETRPWETLGHWGGTTAGLRWERRGGNMCETGTGRGHGGGVRGGDGRLFAGSA